MRRLVAILILTTATPAFADAAVRSFSLPTESGQAISACLSDGQSCGKPAADQFCKKEGFAESILFARERVTIAAALDGDRRCEGETCEAFTRIKCYTPGEGDQANGG